MNLNAADRAHFEDMARNTLVAIERIATRRPLRPRHTTAIHELNYWLQAAREQRHHVETIITGLSNVWSEMGPWEGKGKRDKDDVAELREYEKLVEQHQSHGSDISLQHLAEAAMKLELNMAGPEHLAIISYLCHQILIRLGYEPAEPAA